MEWLQDLIRREEMLRDRLVELAEPAEPAAEIPPASPGEFDRTVRPAIEDMQAALDDYLCGRNADEQSWMSYEVRLKLPLFSHLRSLFSLASAAEV